jgi:heptosyltransferase-1
MNILIVKMSSLGDVIQTIPVVNDLLKQFPDANIDWVVEEAFAPLVHRVVGVRRVLPLAQRRWRNSRWSETTRLERHHFEQALRLDSYDAVIDFQGLIKSALVARSARLNPDGFSATFGNRSDACGYEWPVKWLLQRKLPMPTRIHAVARYRLLAGLSLGYEPQGKTVYPLCRSLAAMQPSVVLAHGTTRADNEWIEDDWIELGRRLIESGQSIALPHANANEFALVNRIALALGDKAKIWPRSTLAEIMDRIAASAGLIGVDSGLSHMAVALDLPVVQIFSQPRAWRAGPVGCSYQVAVGGDRAPHVDIVWQAWQAVSKEAGRSRLTPTTPY